MLTALDYAEVQDIDLDQDALAEWCERASSGRESTAVHVKLSPNGKWHRMVIDCSRTACGKALGAYATRDEVYVGELCEDCFAPYELRLAVAKRIADEEARRELERQYDAEADAAAERKRQLLDPITGQYRKEPSEAEHRAGLDRIRNIPDSSNSGLLDEDPEGDI